MCLQQLSCFLQLIHEDVLNVEIGEGEKLSWPLLNGSLRPTLLIAETFHVT